MAEKHVHDWKLRRTRIRGKMLYKFWKCTAPGCPNPNKMTIGRKD